MLDYGIMCNSACLWQSIHYFVHSCKYVTVMKILLWVVHNHELFGDHGCVDPDIFCLVHEVVKVEILYIHTNVPGYYVVDYTVDMNFNCCQVCSGGADFYRVFH